MGSASKMLNNFFFFFHFGHKLGLKTGRNMQILVQVSMNYIVLAKEFQIRILAMMSSEYYKFLGSL